MKKTYRNQCYRYEQCQQIIESELPLDRSGGFDLSDRWCKDCITRQFGYKDYKVRPQKVTFCVVTTFSHTNE